MEEQKKEKKSRNRNMLEVFAVVEDASGNTAYIKINLPGIYSKPDFHAAIRSGKLDLDALRLKLGIEHLVLVAMRPVDAVTPRTETVIKI